MTARNDGNTLSSDAMLASLPPPPVTVDGVGANGTGDPGAGAGGGVDMTPAEPAAPARPEPVAQPAPTQPEPVMVIGQGREDATPAPAPAQPQAAAPPPQAAPPAPVPDAVPLPVFKETREKWQAERDARMALEARNKALEDYYQRTEPWAQAVRKELPEMRGQQARLKQAEQEMAIERKTREYVQAAYSRGEVPNVDEFVRQQRMDLMLQQAANMPQTVDALLEQRLNGILEHRDQTWAQQQQAIQEQQAQERRAQQVADFEQQYADIERNTPAIAGSDGWKKAVFIEWANKGGQVAVKEVASPYLNALRTQVVAAQAGQMTRAEVHAAMPTTLAGGSGAAASPQNNSMRPPPDVIRQGSRGITAWYKQRLAAGR